MNPTKGEVLLIHAPDLSEEFILNKRVFVLPVGDHRFKVGSTYDWKDLSEMVTENGKASIVERLNNLISVEYTIVEHHAGIRPTVSDRRPILGIHPEFKNISIFNGLGTKGVMLAPYFAKEMLNVLTTPGFLTLKEVRLARFWTGLSK
jgi:glycine oxidase